MTCSGQKTALMLSLERHPKSPSAAKHGMEVLPPLRSFTGLDADANAASESALAPLALLPAAAMAGAPPEALRALQVGGPPSSHITPKRSVAHHTEQETAIQHLCASLLARLRSCETAVAVPDLGCVGNMALQAGSQHQPEAAQRPTFVL